MSTNVITIKGQPCTRRRNVNADNVTIQRRKALRFCETDEASAALALVLASQLPCRNLRLIAGTKDERRDFEVRLAELEMLRAEEELDGAKIRRTRILYGDEAAAEMYDAHHQLHARVMQAVTDLANSPALTRWDLDRKKRAIGNMWLTAEGERYDAFRAAIAADEARLPSAKRRNG